MADGSYKCHDCHMTFGTLNLLQKHKQKFCVGGLVGDPDSLRLRKGLRSADDPPPRQYTPEERPLSGGEKLESKVRQLQALKANREKSRDIRNLQERILLDSLEDTNIQLGYPQLQRSRSRLPLSKDRDVQQLQLEYEMLREKELVHNSEPGYGRTISPLGRDSRLDNYSPMSNTSMSIHLPDDDYQKYNPNQDAQLKQLAENHGRQMEYLQLRNRDLEKQKEDIQRRLGELGNKTRPTGGEDSSQLLAELRAQEERNQKSLDDLKRQLYDINHQRLNIIEVDKGHPPPPLPLPPPPQPETGRKSYVYPIYYGNSMVAEISAIRQAYLQNGGNDPDILHQMAQMQAEAQNIEEQMKKHGYDNRHREKKDNTQITQLELENERLHRELMLLQEQNFLAREKKKTDREEELERQLRQLREDQLRKMYELQNEINLLKNRPPAEITVRQNPPPPPKNADTPWLLQRPYVEVEPMAPYDQYAGFVIFYDLVLNLDQRVTACRLIVGLHGVSAQMGEPTLMPTVYTEPVTRGGAYGTSSTNAIIGARQPVPKCPPDSDLGIVVELQTSGGPGSDYDQHSLITRAWTKLPLFDGRGQLLAGKFRIAFRNVPIKPYLHPSQLQNIEKFQDAELYYRVVNMRDMEVQSLANISPANFNQYRPPAIPPPGKPFSPRAPPTASTGLGSFHSHIPGSLHKPLPPNFPPPARVTSPESQLSSRQERLPSIQPGKVQPQDTTIGFQVDRVKHAENGEGKVRITTYYASTGKIVQSSTSPVTCSTTAVKSNFKHGYHIFGQQEATFSDIDLQGDMVVIARFYLRKRQTDLSEFAADPANEATLYDEETLVAWSAIPLVLCAENLSVRGRRNYNPKTMQINTGTHTLKLYSPPVPDPSRIPFDEIPGNNDWRRYGKGTLRINIFQGNPRPGSLTPSDMSEDGEEVLPEYSWLPCERSKPCRDPFLSGDGFDVYVDGSRYLPDSVTFTKVAGRVLDRKYEVHGKDINATVKLDSDIYNPVYETKTEFRENNIPPSATILFKVYTVDNFYKQLTVVGYATLNVFVESGTERQPTIDKPGLQVSLNEGAHQLRLYSQGPNGVDPLTESIIRDAGIRYVPCASLLVRLTRVAKGPSGKALEQSKVPQADWLRLGLYQPRPKYTDRIYYSTKCMPSKGESKLFHSMMRRPAIKIRDAVAKIAQAKESFYRNDKNLDEYIRNKLTKGDNKPLDIDLTFICQYSAKQGIKVAVDGATNLPWTNFTHAHICLNPPGAFYMGAPHATYDKLVFTEFLDLKSTNTSPQWRDGFKHFSSRSYHRFLTVIVHLQEVQVTVAKENYKYGLLEQAWTPLQAFTDNYCYTSTFQLPLFDGSPSPQMLKQLAREPCKDWMERNIRSGTIHLIEGASVYIRLADARRDDELAGDVPGNKLLEVNTDYIPPEMEDKYARERPGKPLESMVPQGKTAEQFVDGLSIKFKNLVYKLYEEGNVK
ncbi:uncharacterized protein LOC125668024 isoform X3 [Ostrea edulis]|uniref:uncharacterized protein LOC125668024 isoform X3 n=1 Tax=Ostrea edulis TaxID=37623 RepID=UPI0024AF373A|nr:uncharacterized protein LOC125668024 isoform X3 [Ostrea edulis]